jgi:hypothetical protein
VEKNVNKWVGFTEAAASAHIDTNEQPASALTTNSWAMNEDQRVVGSYTITRTQETKTTSVVGTTPPPVIGSVTFSVANNNNLSSNFPLSLTMSTSTAGAVIRYRIDGFSGTQRVTGSWQVSSGSSVTVSVNTTNVVAGQSIEGIAYHKRVIVEAYAYRELQTGTYEGPKSDRTYGYRSPVMTTPTLSPAGSTSTQVPPSSTAPTVTSWPVTITASGSAASAVYEWRLLEYRTSGSFTFTESFRTGNPITVNAPPVTNWTGSGSFRILFAYCNGYVQLDNVAYRSGQIQRQYTSLGNV